MFRTPLAWLIVFGLGVSSAAAQEESSRPTLGAKLKALQRSLTGGDNDNTQVVEQQRRPTGQARVDHWGADRKSMGNRAVTRTASLDHPAQPARRTAPPAAQTAPAAVPPRLATAPRAATENAEIEKTRGEPTLASESSRKAPRASLAPPEVEMNSPMLAGTSSRRVAPTTTEETREEIPSVASRSPMTSSRRVVTRQEAQAALAAEAAAREEAAKVVEPVAAAPVAPPVARTAPKVATAPPASKAEATSDAPRSSRRSGRRSVAPAFEPETPAVVAQPTPAPTRVAIEEERPAREAVVERESPVRTAPTSTVSSNVAAKTPEASQPSDELEHVNSPVLAVDTIGPRTIVVGKEAVYTVAIRNDGDVQAQDVLVNVKIPEWADVVTSEATAGVTRAQTSGNEGEPLQWKVGRLDGRTKEKLSLTLIPRKSRAFDLAVHWTFSQAATQSLVEVQEPKLHLSLSGPDEVMFGQTKLYKLTLSNPGTGDAENVTINLSPLNDDEGIVKQAMGSLKAGETKIVEVELTARQTGAVQIKAFVTAEGGLRADVAEDVLVRRAGLKVEVAAPKARFSGTVAAYEIKVTNPGNATAENVQVVATLPRGAKLLSNAAGGQISPDHSRIVWTVPMLRPGADTAFDIRCSLTAPGANRLQVATTGGADLNDVAFGMTQVEALADLKLAVVHPRGPVGVGEDMIYEVHVHNRGSKSADDIAVVASFPIDVEPIAVQGGAHQLVDGEVIFQPIASLAAGADATFKIKARASRPGNHVFRAEVACRSLGTQLANEETTHCYGEEPGLVKTSPRPGLRSPARLGASTIESEPAAREATHEYVAPSTKRF